ncbi:MAG: CocE/NonD family hydrolase [Pseudomonadota bacterium]
MKRAIKGFLGLLLVVAVLGLLLSLGKQPDAFPEGSKSAARFIPGPYAVETYDIRLVDKSRPSPAHRDFAGTDQRVLQTSVWYPVEKPAQPQPLIVYSHGFTSSRRGGAYLGIHLASYGYVVIAADFPMTTMNAPGGPWVRDVVNQPGDVSFLIDHMLMASAEPRHVLHQRIDPDRIGVTGISLGGMTSTMVTYHPVWGDRRIGASMSIAGPTDQFNAPFFQHRPPVPFLMLAADIDALVPYDSNAAPVLEKVPNAQLITVAGGSHTGFSGPAGSLRYMKNPDALGCWAVKRNVEAEDPDDVWLDQLGTPEQGINYDTRNELCLMDPLPRAMNPLRQQMITAVVVHAFFDAAFSTDPATAEAASEFLAVHLPGELESVSYARRAPVADAVAPVVSLRLP